MSTSLSWWQLPGPAALVAAVADDLDRGYCAVVALPDYVPAGFAPAVQAVLRALAGQPQRWRAPALPPAAPGATAGDGPREWLHTYLPPPADLGPLPAPAHALALAQRPGFGGYRVLLAPDADAAPAWLAFLADYQRGLPQLRHAERTLFLVVLSGAAATALPPAAAGLRTHAYRTQASADLALHLHFACPRLAAEPPLLHRVRLAVAGAVAAFDAATAVRLAQGPLAALLHPAEWLTTLAQERDWPTELPARLTATAAEALWACGARTVVDGRSALHPALLACTGDLAGLRNRVWEGQLPVVLPFLEQRRQALVQRLAPRLRPLLPHQTPSGETLRHLEEIELGDLFRFCISSGELHLEAALRQEIRLLRDCRNQLAHLRPVAEAGLAALAALS